MANAFQVYMSWTWTCDFFCNTYTRHTYRFNYYLVHSSAEIKHIHIHVQLSPQPSLEFFIKLKLYAHEAELSITLFPARNHFAFCVCESGSSGFLI